MKMEYLPKVPEYKKGLIRFYEFTDDERQILVQNLRDLMTGKIASVRIHELPGVNPLEGLEVTAMVGDRQKKVVLLSGNRFNWIERAIDWEDVIERIETLAGDSKNQYQWLTDYGASVISVLFSQDGMW